MTNRIQQEPLGCTVGDMELTLLPRAPYDVAYTPDKLSAGYAFDIQCGEHAFASSRTQPFVTVPGSLAMTPPGCDIRSRSGTGGEYLTVRTGKPAHTPVQQYTNVPSKEAALLATSLRQHLLASRDDVMAIEERAELLFQVAIEKSTSSSALCKPATSMTSRRLRRVADFVENHLGQKISVKELASELGLSTGYFIRAFSAATGLSPHAYVLERRLAEARRLLLRTAGSLADVAVACGFASQAHLTTKFGRHFSLTPAAFRTQFN
jgi:AraC family transcriptional regulator